MVKARAPVSSPWNGFAHPSRVISLNKTNHWDREGVDTNGLMNKSWLQARRLHLLQAGTDLRRAT